MSHAASCFDALKARRPLTMRVRRHAGQRTNVGGIVTRILLLFALGPFLLGASSSSSEILCPGQSALPKEQDDLRMHEREFTVKNAMESLQFLRNDFSSRIFGPGPQEDLRNDSSHYISYANSLRFIEGTLLKQEALIERAQRDTLSARAASRSSQRDAGVRFEAAKSHFCDFLRSAKYVD
jgi:hypothetical protein